MRRLVEVERGAWGILDAKGEFNIVLRDTYFVLIITDHPTLVGNSKIILTDIEKNAKRIVIVEYLVRDETLISGN